ncbi:ferric reductase-like transmembrane domain-containing protein [Candidatus Dojkabacteria bacterium]|jgi:predicted ferric reductase|nr:ferric reductase-like transmembrane domain-containing protein [Candidatus Dojkabacteria bacterium]
MKRLGKPILILIIFITIGLWVLSKPSIGFIFQTPFRSLAQITALIATSLFALDFIFSTRLKTLEKLFGGLDQVYKVHQHMGGIGTILIIYHVIFLAINAVVNSGNPLIYLIPSGILSYTLGIIAFATLIVLISLTLFVNLPYHIWKFTHTLMGIFLGFMFYHVLIISSDVSSYFLLRVWILYLIVLAAVAYIYKRFLYGRFGGRHGYRVIGKRVMGNITEVSLVNTGKKMEFKPGQYVFVAFKHKGLSFEKHPFTISSSPTDDLLTISIKNLGDYTKNIQTIDEGAVAILHGPYGMYGENIFDDSKDMVWVAGGIGITPFISFIKYMCAKNIHLNHNIFFYYATKNEQEAVYLSELKELTLNLPNIHIINHTSNNLGHLNILNIQKDVGELKNKKYYLCAAPYMSNDIKRKLIKKGVRGRNIIYEDFAFLT